MATITKDGKTWLENVRLLMAYAICEEEKYNCEETLAIVVDGKIVETF